MTHLSVERADGVATVTMTNPPRNFLTNPMVQELDAVTRDLEADPSVRVVVLTGGVDGIFITHYDVGELLLVCEHEPVLQALESGEPTQIHGVLNRLERMRPITIAAVNGTAMGGGCELSLACDFRLLADGDFGYGLLETSVGIIPGAGGTQRMARLLGPAKALDLVLHGTVMTPREAHALGLAHRLLPAASFTAGVAEFARGLAARAPLALQAAKQAIRQGVERPIDEALRIEQQAFARTLRTEDARGAMRAYVDGRPFGFQGR